MAKFATNLAACVTVAVTGLPLLAPVPSCRADEPPAKERKPWYKNWIDSQELRRHLGDFRSPEIIEMLTAVVGGSEMGPGEGWFHDGQSRYGWKWLASRHHVDPSGGAIKREEFHGPPELFDRLDRNRDGKLTSSDFDWSERSAYANAGRPSSYWFRSIDTNSNGRISRQEWQEFFAKAAHGKDYLTPDDLREAFPTTPPRPSAPPSKNNGPSPLTLFVGLLNGDLGSMFEGPSVGQRAPDFALTTQDGKRQVRLSHYNGKKPVVLIFGSFT
jgi:hypothetical protein